ncbi:MAG: hypothetical protein GC206_14880 [Alphaproteobacteria bacterium]|nr:hypothetical protein [Alphaproteobacteria bacterium]
MPAHTRSNPGAMRALCIGSAFALGAVGATVSLSSTAQAARPALVRDMCAETSGGGEGFECNSSEDLLVRPKYSDGTCGEWICCPPNGDGSYNCNAGSSPSRSEISSRVRDLVAPRATIVEPAQPTNQTRASRAAKAPAARRN